MAYTDTHARRLTRVMMVRDKDDVITYYVLKAPNRRVSSCSVAAAGRVTSFDRSDGDNIDGGERLMSLWSCTETTESNNTSY